MFSRKIHLSLQIINIFFPLKLGFLNNLNTEKLCLSIEELTEKKQNITYGQEYLLDKWRYRFNQPNAVFQNNIFQTFIDIYREYKKADIKLMKDIHINDITKSYNEELSLNSYDIEYMTEYELYQYTMYNDCNMFTKFIDAPCIILESSGINTNQMNSCALLRMIKNS